MELSPWRPLLRSTDAIAGLCGMIEVADGRRAEAPDALWTSDPREGWILGQIDAPV